MKEKKIFFYSDGFKLDGSLYTPDNLDANKKHPAVVVNSGYQGFNQFYPKLFAKPLTDAGYVCLGFDYRGFAASEGEHGRVILGEQVEDIINAISYLLTLETVDEDQVGILGWGMGASNVVRVAAKSHYVKGVAALNGFYNGARWLASIHSYVEWKALCAEVAEDRIQRVVDGKSRIVDTFHHYPLDPTTSDNVNVELAKIPGFGEQVSLMFTESILGMDAESCAREISGVPMLIAHGRENLLHPIEEALALFEAANDPKSLYVVNGQHNDFMYCDHPEFIKLMDKVVSFFNEAMGEESGRSISRLTQKAV